MTKRGRSIRFSINYEKIFGRPIMSRPIRIEPISLNQFKKRRKKK